MSMCVNRQPWTGGLQRRDGIVDSSRCASNRPSIQRSRIVSVCLAKQPCLFRPTFHWISARSARSPLHRPRLGRPTCLPCRMPAVTASSPARSLVRRSVGRSTPCTVPPKRSSTSAGAWRKAYCRHAAFRRGTKRFGSAMRILSGGAQHRAIENRRTGPRTPYFIVATSIRVDIEPTKTGTHSPGTALPCPAFSGALPNPRSVSCFERLGWPTDRHLTGCRLWTRS